MSIDAISDQCGAHHMERFILTDHSSSTKTVLFLFECPLQTLSVPFGLQDG